MKTFVAVICLHYSMMSIISVLSLFLYHNPLALRCEAEPRSDYSCYILAVTHKISKSYAEQPDKYYYIITATR